MAGKVDAESSGMLQLRWNSHLESLQTIFQDLLDEESFVDVTLSCEGGALRAHRIILSSCSSYFRRVLCDNTCKHPVIIMRDVSLVEMQAILHFMYRGEIRVSEKQLPSLLRTACLLEIRGLAQEFFQQKPRDNTPAETAADQNNYRKRGAGCLENIDKRKIEDDDTVPVAEPKSKESKVVQSPKATRQAKVSSSSSALDLSSDTATENVDLESCKSNRSKTSAKKPLRHAAVSPVPLHVKCEQLNRLDGKDLSEQESPVPDQYPFTVLEDQASTGAVQAVCPFCFKDCKRTAELRAHIRAHTGEKPFRCDICSAPFARSAHLKRHRRVHTGERPFECLRCQKTFSRQDKLKLHMDRHRLRDMGGKTAVGRPRKTKSDDQNEEAASSSSCLPSPASAPTPTPSVELGMGQFAFPGASARPGPAQSPLSSGLPSPGLPLSFSDIGYLSLLSLSHRRLAAPPGDVPSVAKHSQELQQAISKKPAASGGRGRGKGRPFSKESACEALLNFAQQVGGATQSPA